MRKLSFFLITVLLSVLIRVNSCSAQKPNRIPDKPTLPESLLAEPKRVAKDHILLSNRGFVKVPFELISNHVYLTVKVNGLTRLNFLLDTGARSNYIDLSKAEELEIRKVDRKKVKRVSGCDDLSFFKLDSISIGSIDSFQDGSGLALTENLTLFDQTLTGIHLGEVEKFDGKRLDGILGYDFLRKFVVEIDYASRTLKFFEPENFKYSGNGETIKINLAWRIPKIRATIDGEYDGTFRIDTGSRNSVHLYAPFVKEHRLLEKYPKSLETPVGFGITGPRQGRVGRIKSFQLGSFAIKSPTTGFYSEYESPLGSSKIAGNIGGGILKKFKVILDYTRYRMILDKNADYHLRDRYNTSGIQLAKEGEKIIVYEVVKDSPAHKADLRKNDQVLSINFQPVSGYSLQEVREILNQEEGTKIELELKRNGKTEKVKLVLKELI